MRILTTSVLTVALCAGVVLTLTAQSAPRETPIRAQSGPSPVKFSLLDVADGSLSVFGRDDVYARHMGISDLMAVQVQISERLQMLALSGGDPTRARFACVTAEGVLFASEAACDQVRLAPAAR